MSRAREYRAKSRSFMDRFKDTFVKNTPSWCHERDCYFYDTDDCDECAQCTFCGANLGHLGADKDRSHAFRAESHGGRTWVPTCGSCNDSQGTKGFVEWLQYLKRVRPDKFGRIYDYQCGAFTGFIGRGTRRKRISDAVWDVEDR